MSANERPPQESSSAYVVQDRSNLEELERLHLQDGMSTTAMGGVLAEQENPARLRRVLDVGCGTGGWLIETARTYPHIKLLIGVDISQTMIEFARQKAQEAGVADRVEFQVGDALRMLEFPPSFFDLVNQRANFSYVRTWEWWKLLLEERRVAQPEGIIRISEPAVSSSSRSAALNRWFQFLVQTMERAGYFFEPDYDSIPNHLVPLMEQSGMCDIQTRLSQWEFRTGTLQGDLAIEDIKRSVSTMDPFFRKWMKLPDDYEQMCQQILADIKQPDFAINWKWLTAWGKPGDRPVFTSRRC